MSNVSTSTVPVVGQFRETVLDVLGQYEHALTVRDIRHILVEKYRERTTLTQQSVYSACIALINSNSVSRTSVKILHNFAPNGKAAYGYQKISEKVVDNRKVLWIIDSLEFDTCGLPTPALILFDEHKPTIQHDLVGRYTGVERIPTRLKDSAWYADKGWKVVEL